MNNNIFKMYVGKVKIRLKNFTTLYNSFFINNGKCTYINRKMSKLLLQWFKSRSIILNYNIAVVLPLSIRELPTALVCLLLLVNPHTHVYGLQECVMRNRGTSLTYIFKYFLKSNVSN